MSLDLTSGEVVSAEASGVEEEGSTPTIIHVQAQEVVSSGASSIISVKARDLQRDLRTPVAVAQPFHIHDHYGHIAMGDGPGEEGGGGSECDEENPEHLVPTEGRRGRHRPHGAHRHRSIVPGRDDDEQLSPREVQLFEVFRISRCMRQVCSANMVLVGLTGLFFPQYFVIIVLPGLGYYGCRHYRYWPVLVYLTYCVLEMIGGVVAIFLVVRRAVQLLDRCALQPFVCVM